MRRKIFGLLAAAWAAVAGPGWVADAEAQGDYPNRPVRLIVGFPPGGTNDLTARIIATALSKELGQPVAVENRGGQSGSLAAGYVAQQPGDGYTLLYGSSGMFTTNAALFGNLGYDPLKDFSPITRVGRVPNILLVTKSLPANNLQELIDYAKKNPGKLNYGSTGNGTSPHLDGLALKNQAQIDITHIPYRSGGQVLTDLIAGQAIQVYFDNLPTGILQVREGRLKGLAVTSPERSPAAPDIPTLAEAGLPRYQANPGWFSLIGPKNIPQPIVEKLNSAAKRALQDPELVARFKDLGVAILQDTPEQFAEAIRQDHAHMAAFIRDNNIKPE